MAGVGPVHDPHLQAARLLLHFRAKKAENH